MKPYKDKSGTKAEQVGEMFDSIAPVYDVVNRVLTLRIDTLWRRRVVKSVAALEPTKILDVATGTADLAIAMARRIKGAQITGVDLSQGMLALGHEKVAKRKLESQIDLQQGVAEDLRFESEQFDVVTVAFGVRNFDNLERGLEQMTRVTKRGGRVVVLEFSTPDNKLFGWFYNIYSHHVLPRIAALFTRGDRSAYEYLPASVDEFPPKEEFMAMMSRAGLSECRQRALTFGIARIYIGVK